MSHDNVLTLMHRLPTDAVLQERLKRLQEGPGGKSKDALVTLAAEAGLPFSAEELDEAMNGPVLSDAELDAVSGGATPRQAFDTWVRTNPGLFPWGPPNVKFPGE